MRSGGTSARASRTGSSRRVPPSEAAPWFPVTVTTRTSRSLAAASLALRVLTVSVTVRDLSPMVWLCDWSATMTATSGRLFRSSSMIDGLARISSAPAVATVRQRIPGAPRRAPAPRSAKASAVRPRRTRSDTWGAKTMSIAILILPQALEDVRHVNEVCLIVAGQRIHHQIHSEASCHLALALASGDNGGQWPALRVFGPCR